MTKKRKLLFEYHSADSFRAGEKTFAGNIEKLKQNKVKTVFIVTSEEIPLEPYLSLINLYEKNGFSVNSVNIEAMDKEHLPFVKNAVMEINESFDQGSCLIVSFGRSVAGTLLACFYVYSGKTIEEALGKAKVLNPDLINTKEEIEFIEEFREYAGIMIRGEHKISFDTDRYIFHEPAEKGREAAKHNEEIIEKPEETADTIQQVRQEEIKTDRQIEEENEEDEFDTAIPGDILKEEIQDEIPAGIENDLQLSPAEDETEDDEKYKNMEFKGKVKFYSSIGFKLISITSAIIIISLSGMILLATHFFKKDNTIRIQENNLYISQVIGQKINTDFHAVIDKSKLISNMLMQNTVGQDNNSNLIFSNDRDSIFFGVAVPGRGKAGLNFVRSLQNNSLMAENRITEKDIETANTANSGVFTGSFNGEIIVHNVSQGFRIPAIALSLPFRRNAGGGYASILVCYLKLDRFLEAFRSAGITKTYMVNNRGDIIAHSDSRIVLGGGNYINIPIVKSMLKSSALNGFERYADEKGVYNLGFFNKVGIGGCGVIATVEEDVAYKEVYNQRRRDIYLMIIVLTVVILIIYFFGKKLTGPIIRLLGATNRIKNGDYNVRIRPSSGDEIGELTSAFIEMGKGLEEREKIKTTFGKFVNPELVEMLTKDDEVRLGGERKTVVILFSDIRDFTAISERLQPEEVVEFLNAYLTMMVECIDKTGGMVDKFIGDAIMAEWGALVSGKNDSESAVNSALMMRKVLIDFNKARKEKGQPLIKIGCGINTGPVLAGQIGSEDRMEYTVIGDAVNLASRIEALNKPFGTDILITRDTYDLVKDIYAVEKMSLIKVKGKEGPQQIYAVLRRLDDQHGIKTIEELRALLGTDKTHSQAGKEESPEVSEIDSINIQDSPGEEKKYEILN